MLWKVENKHLKIGQIFMESNYKEAITKLNSETQSIRFSAVKFFLNHIHPEAKDILKERLLVEKVRHIKVNLEKALSLLNNIESQKRIKEIVSDETITINDDVKEYFKTQAINEFSGIILHELEPKIGILKTLGKEEVKDYGKSLIKSKIEDFEHFFKSLRNLNKSTQIPSYSEVDIVELIKETFFEEHARYDSIQIKMEGDESLIIKTDKYLLSIILANGIRNALESLSELPENNLKKMIITWGTTDISTWINIMDEGLGLNDSPENAFKLGNTTKSKSDHSGFGLGIIEQAINSLRGEVELTNNNPRGAKLTIRLYNNE